MDDPNQQPSQDLQGLTGVVRDIDVNDSRRDANATHMRDDSGRQIEFNE